MQHGLIYWTEELGILKENMIPKNLPNIATCLHSCGEIMADAGEYDKARQNFEQALYIREKYFPPHHNDIAVSVADLGRLCATQGDKKSARTYLTRALPLFISAFGEEPHGCERVKRNTITLLKIVDG